MAARSTAPTWPSRRWRCPTASPATRGSSFYAKGTPATIQVIFQTRGTQSTDFGGTCTGTCAGNRTTISLNASNWTFYQLPFTSFINGTVPFSAADTLTIEFQAYGTAGVALAGNFWIDDLAFY